MTVTYALARRRSLLCCLAALAPLLLASPALAADKPGFDASLSASAVQAPRARATSLAIASTDGKRGVPTFAWAPRTTGSAIAKASRSPEGAARAYLALHRDRYGLSTAALQAAVLTEVHDTGRGGILVTFEQRIDGAPVFQSKVHVLLDRQRELLAIGGNLHAAAVAPPRERAPGVTRVTEAQAVASALSDLYDVTLGASDFVAVARKPRGDSGDYEAAPSATVRGSKLRFIEPARVRRVYFPLPDRVVSAYWVEFISRASATGESDAYSYVIAADDTRLLYRENLTRHDAFSYRVWADPSGDRRPSDGPLADSSPHPTGLPDRTSATYTSPVLVSMDSFNAPKDPWLLPGATTSRGNNVDAYTDSSPPDGISSADLRAEVTSPGTFDHTYDVNAGPLSSSQQRMASVTQLFYTTNWLHDWWYDSGFDEAAGNAQASNYGRGGVEGDALLAEAQDSAPTTRNNANMQTLSDGSPPRMQLYLWDSQTTGVVIVEPAGAWYGIHIAGFGPDSFVITAPLALMDDGVAPTTNGCEPATSDLTGKIALIDRGTCTFKQKVVGAQSAGAVGAIIVNNAPGAPPYMPDGAPGGPVSIGALSVSLADGDALRLAAESGEVTVTLRRDTPPYLDGSIDNTVVTHEWGHYLHQRLVVGDTAMLGAQGEGWGDFTALQLIVREGDDLRGTFAMSPYATQATSSDALYFGIRRYAYSVDFTKNALTFKHIGDAVALPTGTPTAPNGSANSEVHNAGEVWTSMLFEAYVALLSRSQGAAPAYTFAEARRRMSDYVVAGMKLAPRNPTFTEQRDALLAAAYANDPADLTVMAEAFARRGAGTCAVSPARYSTDLNGVVESFEVAPKALVGSIVVDDGVESCDIDGLLDAGETGNVAIEVMNAGPATLSGATLALATTAPWASFVGEASQELADLGPYEARKLSFAIRADASLAAPASLDLVATLSAPGGCDAVVTGSLNSASNVDVAPSTVDSVETSTSAWTASDETWSRVEVAPGEHAWLGTNNPFHSDASLVSPPLQVGAGGLTLSFEHRHDFEASNGTYWDGGLIEVSSDDGVTWQDLSAYGSLNYGGTIGDAANEAKNPLNGRAGYVAKNPSWPSRDAVTIDLGPAFAEQTIRVRFRVGSDVAEGATGWEVDAIALTGITNQPFLALVDDAASCGASPGAGGSGGAGGGATSPGSGGAGGAGGAVDVDDGDGAAVTDPEAGCGCRTTPQPSSKGWLLSLPAVLALAVRRRRSR